MTGSLANPGSLDPQPDLVSGGLRLVYGTGEVFRAYLLFEAMACADDPIILVVNIDLLEFASMRGARVASRRFLVVEEGAP